MQAPELLVDRAGLNEGRLVIRIPHGSEMGNELRSSIYPKVTNGVVKDSPGRAGMWC